MASTFTILHLSDAHIGKPGCKYDSASVLNSLLADIEKMAGELRPPDLIVFSGDLVHGNEKEFQLETQYDLAKTFLEDVFKKAKGQLGVTPMCIVPGNHDVDRKLVDHYQQLGRDRQTKAIVQEMMYSRDVTWKRTLERQLQWFEFAKGVTGHGTVWNSELLTSHSVFEHNGRRIGVAGFNSSWASHGEGESGKLWLGQYQLDTMQETIADCDFKIAVTHHPLNWLNEEEQSKIQNRVETSFHVYLHGHRHSQWYVDAKDHLVVSAGACYEQAERNNS